MTTGTVRDEDVAAVRGLLNFGGALVATLFVWALTVGALVLFAACVLYLAGRALPLRPRKRR